MQIVEDHSSGTPFFFYLVVVDYSKAAALAFVIDQSVVAVFGIPKCKKTVRSTRSLVG